MKGIRAGSDDKNGQKSSMVYKPCPLLKPKLKYCKTPHKNVILSVNPQPAQTCKTAIAKIPAFADFIQYQRQGDPMETLTQEPVSAGSYIINQARRVNLNPSLLYEAVIDLSSGA